MARNYIGDVDRINYTNTTGSAILSGAPVFPEGYSAGVALVGIGAGATGPVQTRGTVRWTKQPALAIAQGARCFWDAANSRVTTSSGAFLGLAATAAAAGDAEVIVALNEGNASSALTAPQVTALQAVVSGDGTRVSLATLGCDPTGVADSLALIQAAVNAGKKLLVGKGTYRITAPIRGVSGMDIDGVGSDGVIYNDRSSASQTDWFAFLLGDHYSSAVTASTAVANKYALYSIGAVAKGSISVTCTTAGDAANFAVGELCFVASETFQTMGGNSVHDYLQLSKIKSISSGVISFFDPIKEALPGSPKLFKIGGTDTAFNAPFFAVEGVSLRNFAIDALTIAQRWSFYDSTIENIWLRNARTGIVGNAGTKSTIRNIRGTFSYRGVEIKTGANDLTVENVSLSYKPEVGVTPDVPLQTGEQAYDVKLRGLKLLCGSDMTTAVRMAELDGAKITLSDSVLDRAGSLAVTGLAIISTAANAGWGPRDITVNDNVFSVGGNATNYVKVGDQSQTTHPTNVRLSGNRYKGTVTAQQVWANRGDAVLSGEAYESGLNNDKQVDAGARLTVDGKLIATLADDEAFSIRAPAARGILSVSYAVAATSTAQIAYQTPGNTTPVLLTAAATDYALGNAALTTGASDGTDTKFCINQLAGVLYFKNRTGAAVTVSISVQ